MANAVSLGNVARPHGPTRWIGRAIHWARRNSRSGSRRNIASHYDLGNDFYQIRLDKGMHYSSGLFRHPDARIESLALAQSRTVTAILDLSPSGRGDDVPA